VAASIESQPARRIDVIINARSGTPGKEQLVDRTRDLLASSGVEARVQLVRTFEELDAASARARDGDADLVVAGGGDGTIAHVAERLLDTPKVLGVLPLGTFNYFAQRLGVPLDVEGALQVLVTGRPDFISVGEVNGRVFLNNSSIGLYPSLLKKREQTYLRIGRSQMAAYLSAAGVLLQPPALMNLHLVADGVPLMRRTPLVFVAVNPQQLTAAGIAGSECLESGRLAVHVLRPLRAPQIWRVALRAMFRGLHDAPELEVVCARELVVTVRRRHVRIAMDGETLKLKLPLRYQLRVDALRVQRPSDVSEALAHDNG
jgi:diacylglycerol kinase family enzyme